MSSPSIPTFFVNQFSLAFGDNDVALAFGQEPKVGVNDKEVPQALIYMTPKTAKLFHLTLKSLVEAFEAAVGEIKIDPDRLAKITPQLHKN